MGSMPVKNTKHHLAPALETGLTKDVVTINEIIRLVD
jgi:hypothetical protein